ncbi:uncharacterized protein VTP21DRAFT_3770 [Calcarisporiella thermophila]|uniref:uncharacterized protein n=1 Tax=Calcarisporiella thermophila TaxID=911321 RepID=UPI0037433878
MRRDDDLPGLADVEIPLSRAELDVLRKQYLREGELASSQTKFNYAWGLIKSRRTDEQRDGVRLFTELPERRRECLYYLALANMKLGDYLTAKKFAEKLLEHEPNNTQAQKLRLIIEEKCSRDGYIGMAIVGGLVAAAGIAVAAFMKKK